MSTDDLDVDSGIPPKPSDPALDAEDWKQDAKGRYYVPRKDGRGLIWRASEAETVEQGRNRDDLQQATGTSRAKGKRKKDPKPKSKTPPAEVKPKLTTEQLAAALEVPLNLPVIWARVAWQCDFCAQNFATEAPAAALDIARLAEKSEGLRRLLEAWYGIVMIGGGSAGIVRYAGRPFLHHVAPEPVAEIASPMMGVPPRAPRPPGQPHQHPGGGPIPFRRPRTAPNAATPTTPPPSGPPDPEATA